MAETTTAIVTNPVYKMLDDKKMQLARLLPPERRGDAIQFQQMAVTCLLENPKLTKCDPISVLLATACCAKLGLFPGKGLGHAYILPFGNQAVFIAGYLGLVELAYLAGTVIQIIPGTVYEGDEFRNAVTSDGVDFFHNRKWVTFTEDKIQQVYCRAKLKTGEWSQAVMHISEIQAIKKKSPSAQYGMGPWFDAQSFKPMAEKTAFKQLTKWIPTSPQLSLAVSQDNRGMIDQEPTHDLDTLNLLGVDPNRGQMLDVDPEPEPAPPPVAAPPAKKRGRPKGSTNKPKPAPVAPLGENAPPPPSYPATPPVEDGPPDPPEDDPFGDGPVTEPSPEEAPVDDNLRSERMDTLVALAGRAKGLGMKLRYEEKHGPRDTWGLDLIDTLIDELTAKLPAKAGA